MTHSKNYPAGLPSRGSKAQRQLIGKLKILSLVAKLPPPPMTQAEIKAAEKKLYPNDSDFEQGDDADLTPGVMK